MVEAYVTLIVAKRKKFERVSPELKSEVRQRLRDAGYDTNGDPIDTDSN